MKKLKEKDIAQKLKVSISTIKKFANQGKLLSIGYGKNRFFPQEWNIERINRLREELKLKRERRSNACL